MEATYLGPAPLQYPSAGQSSLKPRAEEVFSGDQRRLAVPFFGSVQIETRVT